MKIRIVNKSDHPLPHYETIFSAGMDLRANVPEPSTLQPLERAIVKTGLFIELPPGFEAQVRPRSGLAAKKGITVLNTLSDSMIRRSSIECCLEGLLYSAGCLEEFIRFILSW